MKIQIMHYTNATKRNMVLVTFIENDGGNTTSSVFTHAGWQQLEPLLAKDEKIVIEDQS